MRIPSSMGCARSLVATSCVTFAMLGMLASSACAARTREQERRAEVERRIAYWKAHEVEHAGGSRTRPSARDDGSDVPDTSVPHLLCLDGTLSPTCTSRTEYDGCCANQGGVYVDAWGSVVLAQ